MLPPFIKTMDNQTTIYLTDQEAEQFLEFRENFILYTRIMKQILDNDTRTVIIHKDTDNSVRLIEARRFFN